MQESAVFGLKLPLAGRTIPPRIPATRRARRKNSHAPTRSPRKDEPPGPAPQRQAGPRSIGELFGVIHIGELPRSHPELGIIRVSEYGIAESAVLLGAPSPQAKKRGGSGGNRCLLPRSAIRSLGPSVWGGVTAVHGREDFRPPIGGQSQLFRNDAGRRHGTRGEAFRPWSVCSPSGHEPLLDPRRGRAFRRRPTPRWNRPIELRP